MNHTVPIKEQKEKRRVAMSSIIAAVGLTTMKLVVGISTGSLGILSEALHSALDLVAASMTYFAVKIADKPADKEHNFGHGKVENLSALFQTLLLFVTCGWIVWEGISRLTGDHVEVNVTFWAYFVVVVSIVVDISRSRALKRVAKKYNSQALEADALHFSTDILSSIVVLVGLIGAAYHFYAADSIAALAVAVIVIYISFQLGKKSIDVLLDRSPANAHERLEKILKSSEGVKFYHDIKIRTSGATTFIAATIHVQPGLTIEEAHGLTELVELKIKEEFANCQILIHQEPDIDTEHLTLK